MRIISSFSDYYDVVQRQGQDQTLHYIREKHTVKLPKYPFPELRERWWSWRKLQPQGIIVGFCGKIFPVIKLVKDSNDIHSVHTYCFNDHEVLKWVFNNTKKKDVRAYGEPLKKRGSWRQTAASTRVAIEKFFSKAREQFTQHEKLFEQFESPIFMANTNNGSITQAEYPVEINPCLRDIEFYRLIDPYTAFQELSMYLGSLAQPEKPIPAVSDKDMLVAKGFNKYSFRKDPSTKRRRT